MPEIQIRSFFSGKRQADPPSWNTGPCQTRSRCRWLVYPARPAYAAGTFSGAGFSDNGDKFSLPNLDIHMIDGFDLIFPRPIKFAKLIRF